MKPELEGSGGGAPGIYNKEGSGTPYYVDDPENEGLFRDIVSYALSAKTCFVVIVEVIVGTCS